MAEMSDGIILVGIDEAGYGPILGPMVASATAFEVPGGLSDACLWKALRKSVRETTETRDSRIPILDSKKLYHRKEGLARLERSVLSAVHAWQGSPSTMRRLLGCLCSNVLERLGEYPWYREADPDLPTSADAGSIRIAGNLLKRDLSTQSIRLAGCWSEVLLEGQYNRLVNQTRNKAVVLFGLVLRLIHRVAEAYPRHELRIFVDKQGARDRYAEPLLQAFQDRRLKVLEENDDDSAYELVSGPSKWRVRFTQSGESKHLPVALASLISKYLRELLMGCFNAYWSEQVPDLRSTAGYYQDGLRFLKAIRPHVRRLGIDEQVLIRQRSGVEA
ncbi:MAG: hypothetical protein MI923_12840 [Phycisphaerales bacterium]|nr:hypothetical protein [Phycisphaerales bacterium]